MNLMFLVDTLGGGGAEKTCLNIASALSVENNVTIVTIFDEPDVNYPFSDRITVERLNMVIGGSLASKLKAYFSAFRKLHYLKKKYQIDCCVSFLETANFFNSVCPAGDKKIISIRNYYPLSINTSRTIRNIKAKIASKLANRIVCVSDVIRAEMIADYKASPAGTITIYNFIDDRPQEEIEPKTKNYQMFQGRIRESSFNFISVGRLSRQKGHAHLIRSFRKVISAIPGAHLFIMGQGELEKDLQVLTKECGLENNILFLSFEVNTVKYLERSDAYVTSSLYEGMSNAMLEAMHAGLPVISTDCLSGPREILAPGTDFSKQTHIPEMAAYGILTPVCSGNTDLLAGPMEEAEVILAEMMIKIAEDPQLRKHYSEKARQRAADFNKQKTIDQWRALISDLTGAVSAH